MKTIPDSLSPLQAWERMSKFERLGAVKARLKDASNHRLAENFTVLEDVPLAPRSFMDGYAVRSADMASVPAKLRLAGEILMGEAPRAPLHPGETMAIPTGGYLPRGADAVVMQENTVRREDAIEILQRPQPGENVQSKGEDFRKGEVLFRANHRLRPQDLAAIATFGVSELQVYRRPALRVISTGNELVPAEAQTGPGQIRETNALALTSAAGHFGFPAQPVGIVVDDLAAQRSALDRALTECDVVLISGGSSVGERDYTIPAIQSFADHHIHFHGLSIRPGNPTIFASIGERFVFGLPGQPVSSLIVFYQFVLPLLFHLSGDPVEYSAFNDSHFHSVKARLSEPVKPLKTKTDYLRLRLIQDANGLHAQPVLGKSASLSTLALADGFAIIPPGEISIPVDTPLTVYLFP